MVMWASKLTNKPCTWCACNFCLPEYMNIIPEFIIIFSTILTNHFAVHTTILNNLK